MRKQWIIYNQLGWRGYCQSPRLLAPFQKLPHSRLHCLLLQHIPDSSSKGTAPAAREQKGRKLQSDLCRVSIMQESESGLPGKRVERDLIWGDWEGASVTAWSSWTAPAPCFTWTEVVSRGEELPETIRKREPQTRKLFKQLASRLSIGRRFLCVPHEWQPRTKDKPFPDAWVDLRVFFLSL